MKRKEKKREENAKEKKDGKRAPTMATNLGWNMLLAGGPPQHQEARRRRILHGSGQQDLSSLRVARPVNEITPCIGHEYWHSAESLAWRRMEETLLLTNFAAPLYTPSSVVAAVERNNLIDQFVTSMHNSVYTQCDLQDR